MKIKQTSRLLFGLLAALTLSANSFAYDHYKSFERQYSVTLTNITKGIIFTPFLATTHNKHIGLFEVGEAASESVGRIAEGGDISMLKGELDESQRVFDTSATDAPLLPGESVTLEISSARGHNRLSLISMLLPTNDSMAALLGKKLPKFGSKTFYLKAYDAGTETNDEYCANIPGPQCGGTPFSPEDEGEGYIFPAAGIHGEGDLSREAYQWTGPVIEATVTRTH